MLAGGGGGGSPGSTGTDADGWIGSTGGSWGSASNWRDVTSGANPATAAPGANDPVTIAGPTGSTYEVIGGGGASASLSITGLVDLLGAYTTGALTEGSAGTPGGQATFTSGSLTLGAGSQVTASSAAVVDGSTTISGAGAELSVSGALIVGSPIGDSLPIDGQVYSYSQGASGSVSVAGGGTLVAGDANVEDGSLSASGSGTSVTLNGGLTLGVAPTTTSYVSGQPYYYHTDRKTHV